MKSELKKLENSIVSITVEEDIKVVNNHRKAVIKDLQKNADIKGFRKGTNIPEAILVKQFGEEAISSMCIEKAIDEAYQKALRENKVLPMAQAQIKEISSEGSLKFTIEVEVYPEVEIKKADYDKIEIKKTGTRVTQKEVDAAIEDIRTRLTNFVPVEDDKYEAQKGDKVMIDTEGYDLDGNFLDSTKMENYPLLLGSNMLVPGFEEKLEGAKIGQDLELEITFPKDYHNEAFKGKETKFKVKVNGIEKAEKPEITPEFTKAIRGQELDEEGFKTLIKEEISDTKKANARMKDEEALIDELIKVAKVEVGDNMLKGSIDKVFAEVSQNVEQSGARMKDYIASLGMDEAKYKEENLKPIAMKRVQGELILQKIQETEDVQVSKKEIDKEIADIISKYQSEEVKERLKDLYQEGSKYYNDMVSRLNFTKLIDKFIK